MNGHHRVGVSQAVWPPATAVFGARRLRCQWFYQGGYRIRLDVVLARSGSVESPRNYGGAGR